MMLLAGFVFMFSTIFVLVIALTHLAEVIVMAYRYGDLEILAVIFFGLCMIISAAYLMINGC